MKKFSKLEAVNALAEHDHGFLVPEFANAVCEPFGTEPRLLRMKDTRSHFKGLTLYGKNPETGREFKEGDYSSGIEAHKLAIQLCNHLDLRYPDFFGIGSQLRGCIDVLRKNLNEG